MLVPLGAPDGRSRWEVTHDHRRFVVVALGGGPQVEYAVVDAACPHRGGDLAAGIVRDGAIVCPSHWYCFDLRTGACRTTPSLALGRYEVSEREGELYAEIPPRPRRTWARFLHRAVGRHPS